MKANQSRSQNKQGKKTGKSISDRPLIEPNAGGVDVGAREMYVAIPPDRDAEPVRVFQTFTADLEELADWLVEKGVTTVAMESTGVYWIPLYQILEDHGIRVCLVNARHMKNVPGRRTDWHECQWLQYLHSCGLLRAAFRPEQQVCAVRSMLRHRRDLVQMAVQHVQHMQKSLTQMNLQIQHVISDITGVTGTAIIDAILKGKRDATELAKLRHPNIHADPETIRKSLEGDWRPEHLFTLRQSRDLYDQYRKKIEDCDQEIARKLGEVESRVDVVQKPLPAVASHKRRRKRTGDLRLDARQEAYRLYGIDVTRVPGLDTQVIGLFGEVGRDLKPKFGNGDRFGSWLGLCPDNDKSGGRILWTGVRKIHNRAGQMFRLAASALHHSPTPLGTHLRRMKSQLGPEAGITATAHKIALIFFAMVTKQVEYDESIWAERDKQRNHRHEQKVIRQARQLGYELVRVQTAASPSVP